MTTGLRKPRRAHGMSLVELMVGLSIGLFGVAVMGVMYVGSKTTYVAQESGSRLQENGRFAMDTIANDLRMSGFKGCLGSGAVDNTLNTSTALLYNFGEPIWGSRSVGGAWSPLLGAPADTLAALPAGDVLVVRRPTGLGWALIGEMASPSAPLPITPTANFAQGDLLVVADCGTASVFQATNAAPGAGGSLAHVSGTAGVVPGVATNAMSRAYANEARVWRMQTLIYYLANSERHPGESALWVYANPVYDGRAQRTELVTGVERMAVTYGVDTNGDFNADRFFDASGVTNWAQVVNARVELLLNGGTASNATASQPYVFGGLTVTPTDKKLRTVMSMVVALRNVLP